MGAWTYLITTGIILVGFGVWLCWYADREDE